MDDILYDKHYTCLSCASEFTTKKVRSNRTRPLGRDSDLCNHFEGIIPYYYESNVCPYCGFAFTDSFSALPSQQKEVIYNDYASRFLPQGPPNICTERDEDTALQAFKLALGAGYAKKERPRILAGICMRLAWLHRFAGRGDAEREFLQAANRFFQVAFETEQSREDDAHFLHMLGDTSLRLGNTDHARQWFGQLFTRSHSDYAHLELAREAWAARKQEY